MNYMNGENMKKLIILIPLILFVLSCSEKDADRKDLEPQEKADTEKIADENELLDEFPEESYNIIYFKINIYDILNKKIDEDRRDSQIRKILKKAKEAEQSGENAYNVFISEYNKNKDKLKKLSHYFNWAPSISDDIISREMYNSIFQETQNLGSIIKERLKKIGIKNTRLELLKAGVIKIFVPKNTPTSSIDNIILKPGKFEFALVKNDAEIPRMLQRINESLAPKRKTGTNKNSLFALIFTNLFNTYYLPPQRNEKPVVVDYSKQEFPEGYYYFSFYDIMLDDIRRYLNMDQVQSIIPKNLLLLHTPYPKAYYSAQTQDTFRVYDLYFIDSDNNISGELIEEAFFSYDKNKKPAVFIELNDDGAKKLKRLTSKNIGKNLALILDSKVYDAPIISQVIEDGKLMLKNIRSEREAKYIEHILMSGSYNLPVYKYEPED